MIQEPHKQFGSSQALFNKLQKLSFREQLEILLRATRQISHRDKAMVLRAAGLHFVKARLLSIVVRFLLKRLIKGAVWSAMYIVIVIVCVILLAIIEQTNRIAVLPVIAAAVTFYLSFILSTFVDFGRDASQFLRTTVSREEREHLLRTANALNQEDKVAILRALSIEIARKAPGDSLLASFLTGLTLLVAIGLLIGLILFLSSVLPVSISQNTPFLLIGAATLAFLGGFFIPRLMQRRGKGEIVFPSQKDTSVP